MKLYSRQLNSIEELRKEKQRLKAKLKNDPLLPKEGKKTKAQKLIEEEEGESEGLPGILSNITDALSSSSFQGILGTVGMPLLSLAGKQIKRKAIVGLAKELIGGYVKWKVVELGYKAARSYMKKQKAKKQAQAAKA